MTRWILATLKAPGLQFDMHRFGGFEALKVIGGFYKPSIQGGLYARYVGTKNVM